MTRPANLSFASATQANKAVYALTVDCQETAGISAVVVEHGDTPCGESENVGLVDEAVGEHGRERGMGAAFVKIGARYINLSALLWVEVQEEKPKQRLMLVYHTFQDGRYAQLTLEGDEATQMRDILHNIKRN